MKKSVIMVLALTALFGCSKMEQEVGVDVNGNPIGGVPVDLTGVVEGTVSTRGDGVFDGLSSVPVAGLEVNLYRADANAGGTYSAFKSAAINGILQQSGAITGHGQYWQTEGYNSAFIAVYPRFASYTGGTTITGTLDGSTDLMSSELKQGNKTSNTTVALKLKHLLAKVEVQVKVEADAPVTWGNNLTGINLVEQKQAVSLALPSSFSVGSFPASATVTPTFTDATGVFPVKTATGDTPANQSLTSVVSTAVSYGHVMFAPGSQKLKFKVTTSSQTDYEVLVPKNADKLYEAGHKYTLIFTFTPGGDGLGVAVLESDGDSGLDNYTSGGDTPVGL